MIYCILPGYFWGCVNSKSHKTKAPKTFHFVPFKVLLPRHPPEPRAVIPGFPIPPGISVGKDHWRPHSPATSLNRCQETLQIRPVTLVLSMPGEAHVCWVSGLQITSKSTCAEARKPRTAAGLACYQSHRSDIEKSSCAEGSRVGNT